MASKRLDRSWLNYDYRRILAWRRMDIRALGRFAWSVYWRSQDLVENRESNVRTNGSRNYLSLGYSGLGGIPCRICGPGSFYLERDDWAQWFCHPQCRIRNLSDLYPNHLNHGHGIHSRRHSVGNLYGIRQCPERSSTT